MSLLEGKVALITGGNSGIGKVIARQFADQGAQVIIMGRNLERGNQVVNELLEDGKKAVFYSVDVSNTEEVKTVFDEILVKFPVIDIVVNNAGVTKDNLFIRMKEEEWDFVIDINLKSIYNVCRNVVRPMMKARKGKIINISSVIGLIGNIGQCNYAASKAGMIGLTKSLARELASRKICVNAIAPGFIGTEMTDKLNAKQKEALILKVPMGRIGFPEEVAKVAVFLASEMSSYMTGQVLTVDGGLVM